MNLHRILPGLAVVACLHAGPAAAAIDLNQFGLADLEVTIALDGMSADFAEPSFIADVLLENDPFLDPIILVPAAGKTLKFDYDFTNPSGDNTFLARLIDSDTYDDIGNPLRFDLPAAGFDFSTQATSSGTVSFDLGPLAGAFAELGMQFWLMTPLDDAAMDASLTVSNLRITTVPVPGAAVLLFSALAGLTALGRRGRRRV